MIVIGQSGASSSWMCTWRTTPSTGVAKTVRLAGVSIASTLTGQGSLTLCQRALADGEYAASRSTGSQVSTQGTGVLWSLIGHSVNRDCHVTVMWDILSPIGVHVVDLIEDIWQEKKYSIFMYVILICEYQYDMSVTMTLESHHEMCHHVASLPAICRPRIACGSPVQPCTIWTLLILPCRTNSVERTSWGFTFHRVHEQNLSAL